MKETKTNIKNLGKRIISFILAFTLLLGGLPILVNNEVKAVDEKLSLYRRKGNFTGSAYFHLKSSSGWSIACEDPDYHPPVENGETITFTTSKVVEVKDSYLKKMIYHINDFVKDVVVAQGWNGQGTFEKENGGVAYSLNQLNNKEKAYHLLHFFLGNYHNTNRSYFREGYLQYIEYLKKKSKAPSYLKLYRLPRGKAYGSKAESTRPSSRPYQDMLIFKFEYTKEFNLRIKKESNNLKLSNSSKKNYSLQGAEFGVYYNRTDAQADRNRIAKLVTNKNGLTNTVKLKVADSENDGKYYFKELKAPKGFKRSNQIVDFTMTNSDRTITFKNSPKSDPLNIMLRKQGDNKKPLAGAEFEVKYYPDSFNRVSDISRYKATKTWTFKTGSRGEFGFREFDQRLGGRISGDTLFKDEHGIPTGAIGTYTFKEIKAPKGFKVDSTIYLARVRDDGSYINFVENGTIYKAPTVINSTQKMQFVLNKEDFLTIKTPQGQNSSLEKAVYNLIRVSDKKVIKTLTTGKNGIVKSGDLELGTYDIVEKTPSKGYTLNPIAIRVTGKADKSGQKYTKDVIQERMNISSLIQAYNKKVDEVNKIKKENGVSNFDKKISERKIELKKSSNPNVYTAEMPDYGRFEIRKTEDKFGNFKPEAGVKFNLYDWKNKLVDTLETNKEGKAFSKILLKGEYTLKQASHKEGMIDLEPVKISIKGGWTVQKFDFVNKTDLKTLQIIKLDEETKKEIPQKGVVFELYYANGNKFVEKIGDKEVSQFVTDEKGKVNITNIKSGAYKLKEIKAPKGYFLDPKGDMIDVKIPDDNGAIKLIVTKVINTPQKGRLILEKTGSKLVDAKLDEKTGITKLKFEDGIIEKSVWELRAKEDIYSGDKKTLIHKKGDLVKKITTLDNKVVSVDNIALGKYTLKEVYAPKNYVLDEKTYDIEFTPQAQEIKLHSITEKKYNERKDLEFNIIKKFENSKYFTRNPKATFGLYLAKDYVENGITLKKDTLLDIKEFKATLKDVVETTEKEPVMKTIKEDVERFEVDEFRKFVKNDLNKPVIKTIEKDIVRITYFDRSLKKNVVVEFNTLEEAKKEITSLSQKLNIKESEFKIDKIKKSDDVITGYEKITEEELIKVHKANTKENLEKVISEIKGRNNSLKVRTIKTTVTKQVFDEEKTQDVVKAKELEVKGKFEKLLIDGEFYIKEIKTHKDYVLDENKHEVKFDFDKTDKKHNQSKAEVITNKLQRLELVVIKTEMGSNKEISVAGAKYRLVAVDEVKGKSIVGEYITDKDGKISVENLDKGVYYLEEVSAPKGYFKDESKHEIDLSKNNDGEEKILEIEDEKIPEIKTNAEDDITGKKTHNPTKVVTIKDKVSFKDLIINKKYVVKGVLMDKATNKPLLDKQGNPYTSELEFIAKTREGFVTLKFNVDGEILRGKTTVVFEDLYRDEKLVYSHRDINDKDQTTKTGNPEVGTRFADVNDEKELLPLGVVEVTDTVSYKDLIVGDEYELKLVVMNKETKKPLLDKDGKEIVVIKKFIAKTKDGQVGVSVNIDLDLIRGISIVAFEELSFKGEVLANHKDINDDNQTIVITDPEIKTKFADFEGQKEVHALKKVKLIDNVYYKDLVAGKEYELKLRIAVKGTNGFIKDDKGEDLVITKKFVADKKEGMIPVEVEVDLSKYEGKEIVAFERLYHNGIEIAIHEDINDKDQTVKVLKNESPKTEDGFNIQNQIFILVSGFISLYIISKIRKVISPSDLS